MARYCVKCGRELGEETPIVNGLCPDCFLRDYGVFRETPVLDIVFCSKCGLWRYHGRWVQPLSIEEIIRRMVLDNQQHYVNSGVEIIEVDEVSSIHRVGRSFYEAVVKMHVLLGSQAIYSVSGIVRFSVSKTVCPQCMRRASKSFNALVQVRSARGRLSDDEKSYVRSVLQEPSIASDIVEVIETRNGFDVKMFSPVTARRLASIINRDRGARVIETFKTRRYDPSRGRREGVTTISIRLPDLVVGDVVSYNGSYGVVCSVGSSGFKVVDLESGVYRSFKFDDYWSKRVVREESVVVKEYVVVGYDSSMVYLLDPMDGSMIEYPRLANLNSVSEGDRIKGYWVKGRMYMARI